MASWQLQEAKNKLSELIDQALSEGPQIITRHGVEIAVVIPFAKYKKLTAPPTPGRFLPCLPAAPQRTQPRAESQHQPPSA